MVVRAEQRYDVTVYQSGHEHTYDVLEGNKRSGNRGHRTKGNRTGTERVVFALRWMLQATNCAFLMDGRGESNLYFSCLANGENGTGTAIGVVGFITSPYLGTVLCTCASEDRYTVPLSWLKQLDDATATVTMQYAIEITHTPVSAHQTREGRMVPGKESCERSSHFPHSKQPHWNANLIMDGIHEPGFRPPALAQQFFSLSHVRLTDSGWDGADLTWDRMEARNDKLDWVGHCTAVNAMPVPAVLASCLFLSLVS